MATKITELASWTSPDGDDYIAIVVDDGGTPATKKMKVSDLLNAILYHTIYLKVLDKDTDLSAQDGLMTVVIPDIYNGKTIVSVEAEVSTPSTSGSVTVQVHNLTDSVDILSTLATIESGNYSTYTSIGDAVVANGILATGDMLRVDVDSDGTGVLGLGVILKVKMI